MNCPHCGLEIEEGDASFCPHCGGPLGTITLDLPPRSGSLPSQPIHEAPTRISASSHPGEGPAWSSHYGQPPGSPATPPLNAVSGPGQPVFQPLSNTPTTPPASLPPLIAPPKMKRGRLVLSILALLIVFASGVGVGLLVPKAQPQQAPIASKTPLPTSTPTPSPTPIPVERVIFTDPLTAPTHPWHVDTTDCLFKNSSYHILKDTSCYAPIGCSAI